MHTPPAVPNSATVLAVTPSRAHSRAWLVAAVGLLVLWLDLYRLLSFQWSASDQYAYGWFVPWIQAGLIYFRWLRRPSPAEAGSGTRWSILLWASGLVLVPLRIVCEINPDWPLVSWMYATSIVAFTLGVVQCVGGASWVKHFGFVVAFALVAVRWPSRIESYLTVGLMRIAAMLTVEALGFVGIPALTRGNLIEIDSGVVGVDEACSGIRSLQSTLMGALYLGEYYRLSAWGRLRLVVYGGALAFGFNCVRTTFLTWHAATSGIEAIDKLHDPAGLTILVATLACLWWVAARMVNSRHAEDVSEPSSVRVDVSLPVALSVCAVGIGCIGGAFLWYRTGVDEGAKDARWRLRSPREAYGSSTMELSAKERRELGADEHIGLRWRADDGSSVMAWWFRWSDKSLVSLVKARCHRPDVCLPASGMRLTETRELKWFEANGVRLPFRSYRFEGAGPGNYVFFCLWQDGTERFGATDNLSRAGRLDAVWRRTTRMGQQTLQVMITGPRDHADAEERFRRLLPQIVEPIEDGTH